LDRGKRVSPRTGNIFLGLISEGPKFPSGGRKGATHEEGADGGRREKKRDGIGRTGHNFEFVEFSNRFYWVAPRGFSCWPAPDGRIRVPDYFDNLNGSKGGPGRLGFARGGKKLVSQVGPTVCRGRQTTVHELTMGKKKFGFYTGRRGGRAAANFFLKHVSAGVLTRTRNRMARFSKNLGIHDKGGGGLGTRCFAGGIKKNTAGKKT